MEMGTGVGGVQATRVGAELESMRVQSAPIIRQKTGGAGKNDDYAWEEQPTQGVTNRVAEWLVSDIPIPWRNLTQPSALVSRYPVQGSR
jgi:hypothetical protein